MNNYQSLRELAQSLAAEAGCLVKNLQQKAIANQSTKSTMTDLVTMGDTQAEKLIVDALADARPDDAVIGEEGTDRPGTSGVVWHIDPIDGTTNYVYGLPYAVSIAAEANGRLVAGAVAVPDTNDLYSAALNQGATRNGEIIRCSTKTDAATALVATGFAYNPAKRQRQAGALQAIIGQVRDVRRVGSAALDLCYVASGTIDAYFEAGLNQWDMAAGIVIAGEAGALTTDLDGNAPTPDFMLAAPKNLHEELTNILQLAYPLD